MALLEEGRIPLPTPATQTFRSQCGFISDEEIVDVPALLLGDRADLPAGADPDGWYRVRIAIGPIDRGPRGA